MPALFLMAAQTVKEEKRRSVAASPARRSVAVAAMAPAKGKGQGFVLPIASEEEMMCTKSGRHRYCLCPAALYFLPH